MKTITIELPGDLFPLTPGGSADEAAREFRLAAAIEWYREGRVSQGKGAEIAGLSRADFLDALFQAKVPACQQTAEEVIRDLNRAREADGRLIPTDPPGR